MRKSLTNSHRDLFLSVVIPAYNEVENFKRGVLDQILKYLKTVTFSWELILVNDGSTDETSTLLENFAQKFVRVRLVNISHGGKLKAIEAGVKNAQGYVILISDFDQSTPISEFNKFLPNFEKGADIVIGNRVAAGAKRINDPFFRYVRSRVLNFLIKIFLFGGISDTQCGFKALKTTVAKKLLPNLKITHSAKPKGAFMGPWDIELLFLAKKAKLKIAQVPVTWQYFPSRRLSVISEPARFIFDILRIRQFYLLGKYKDVFK